jgi:hypothetical protein
MTVRRTISLIDNRFTKYKRRIPPTPPPRPQPPPRSNVHDGLRLTTIPDNANDAAEGSAINRRQAVSIEPAPTSRYL